MGDISGRGLSTKILLRLKPPPFAELRQKTGDELVTPQAVTDSRPSTTFVKFPADTSCAWYSYDEKQKKILYVSAVRLSGHQAIILTAVCHGYVQ